MPISNWDNRCLNPPTSPRVTRQRSKRETENKRHVLDWFTLDLRLRHLQ